MSKLRIEATAVSDRLAATLAGREAGERMIAALADQKGEFSDPLPTESLHGLLAGILEIAGNGSEGEARARLQAFCRAVGPYLGAGARMLYPFRHKYLAPEQPSQPAQVILLPPPTARAKGATTSPLKPLR